MNGSKKEGAKVLREDKFVKQSVHRTRMDIILTVISTDTHLCMWDHKLVILPMYIYHFENPSWSSSPSFDYYSKKNSS